MPIARARFAFSFATLLGLAGCGTDDVEDADPDAAASEVTAGTACAGLRAGPGEDAALPLSLSKLHASYRFFGPHAATVRADEALVAGLRASTTDPAQILKRYAESSIDTCTMPASRPSARTARVDLDGNAAFIRHGTGDLTIPSSVESVIVDLRSAVEGPELSRFLASVARTVLSRGHVSLVAQARVHHGMRDEAYSPFLLGQEGMYANAVEPIEVLSLEGGASRSFRVGVVLGDRYAPSAARFAIALRAAGLAAILGHPVQTRVAESLWFGAARTGLSVRVMTLLGDSGPLPDLVASDVPAGSDAALARSLAALGPLDPVSGPAHRSSFVSHAHKVPLNEVSVDRASRIAALLALHGATKTFFPYWDIVGDASDARLLSAVEQVDATRNGGPDAVMKDLGFFLHATHDSHGFVNSLAHAVAVPPTLPVTFDEGEAGEVFVRTSADPRFAPGDVLIAVDGRAPASVMAERSQFFSSSRSSAFRNGAHALTEIASPSVRFALRAPNATSRVVEVTKESLAPSVSAPPVAGSNQRFLTSEGHPDLYYVNFDGPRLNDDAGAARALAGIDSSRGVVVDLRGYPGQAAYTVLGHLLTRPSSVTYELPVVSAFGSRREPIVSEWPADPTAYRGKVAVLVGPSTQSAAEDMVLVLQGAARVRVFGRPSAGADGNITGVLLPGGFTATFTGLGVKQPDGGPFHGIGVIVDERVAPRPYDIAQLRDPELESAIAWLVR